MDYRSITETAAALGVSRVSVHSRIKRGVMKAERVGHQWAIPVSEIERLQSAAEIAKRAKYIGGRKGGDGDNDEQKEEAAYEEGHGLTATSTTNKRGSLRARRLP